MNIKRYEELAEIHKHDLLTLEEQEEYIAICTEILYDLMKNDKEINDVLCRLRNR